MKAEKPIKEKLMFGVPEHHRYWVGKKIDEALASSEVRIKELEKKLEKKNPHLTPPIISSASYRKGWKDCEAEKDRIISDYQESLGESNRELTKKADKLAENDKEIASLKKENENLSHCMCGEETANPPKCDNCSIEGTRKMQKQARQELKRELEGLKTEIIEGQIGRTYCPKWVLEIVDKAISALQERMK